MTVLDFDSPNDFYTFTPIAANYAGAVSDLVPVASPSDTVAGDSPGGAINYSDVDTTYIKGFAIYPVCPPLPYNLIIPGTGGGSTSYTGGGGGFGIENGGVTGGEDRTNSDLSV